MIHKQPDGTCSISAQQIWRPGIYESEQTARAAQRLPDEALQRLQDEANARGGERTITADDIRKARQQ